MTQIDDRTVGRRDGVKRAIQWLHDRADQMNDPHARAILNTAAFNLGNASHKWPVLKYKARHTSLTAYSKGQPLPDKRTGEEA